MKGGVNEAMVYRFVESLSLRTEMSKRVYRCVLRRFTRFVNAYSPEHPPTRETLDAWLRNRSRVWPQHMVFGRARLVDRFLDWSVSNGALASNPLADLRHHYGQRTTTPIVRALLSPNPDEELEKLRPPPRFASHLGPILQEYLTLMKSIGCSNKTYEYEFLRFDRFLQTRTGAATQPLPVLVKEWSNQAKTPYVQLQRIEIGRVIGRALHRTDPTVTLPKIDRQLVCRARQQQRRPYIYSVKEVGKLLATALGMPSPRAPLRPLTIHTMIVLCYCVGLRLSEIVNLKVSDIDFHDQSIYIRDSKFFKDRFLPLPASVMGKLRVYCEARKKAGASSRSNAPLFWNEQKQRGYSPVTVEKLLVSVLRKSGLKPATGRLGPRVHDLRHAFAVHRLTAWYREGEDPQSRLVYLATYLGHKDIKSTLCYLTITHELLQQANERFHSYGAVALNTTKGGGSCD